MKKTTITLLTATLSLISTGLTAEIDWDRAKELRRKMQNGQTLSEEDSAYLKTAMEARAAGKPSRSNTTRGDGSDEVATVAPVNVSEEDSPVQMLSVTASDGYKLEIAYRAPKADRPLPAVIFIHGSLGNRRLHELVDNVTNGPTPTRFLAAGYIAVCGTFRTYGEEPQSRGPILDSIAIVQAVKKLPEVDSENVIIFGTSGGGSIALELAGSPDADPLAVIAGEPASVLFSGVMTGIANRESSMKDYPTLYTDELREIMERKIAAISCPILIHHGDRHPLKNINFDLIFPTIEAAGKSLRIENYPGEDHGFYWGNRTSTETVEKVLRSSLDFIEPLLTSKPEPGESRDSR
ncbi:MAG: dienelactone hydrolase family protein [Verrucomicrobiales bacterium]|nr:dienelactone hydrolase family protein [Verrucomicrobiales bacterium]